MEFNLTEVLAIVLTLGVLSVLLAIATYFVSLASKNSANAEYYRAQIDRVRLPLDDVATRVAPLGSPQQIVSNWLAGQFLGTVENMKPSKVSTILKLLAEDFTEFTDGVELDTKPTNENKAEG